MILRCSSLTAAALLCSGSDLRLDIPALRPHVLRLPAAPRAGGGSDSESELERLGATNVAVTAVEPPRSGRAGRRPETRTIPSLPTEYPILSHHHARIPCQWMTP